MDMACHYCLSHRHLHAVARRSPLHLGEFLRPFFQTLYEVLASNLNYTESLKVRLAALDATCTVVQVLYQPNERAALQELIPVMLSVRLSP